MGYYVIQKNSESYTLQEDKSCNVQIRTSGDLVVKVQYMNFIQYNKKWYW